MTAYYNENDSFAAAWLRELIKSNLIALGEVDERSIEEIKPEDLREFTQCHFFAGIGVWSYALRNAGWSDDSPVWTGSCPCQGFSASGQRGGFSDKRHLWPTWFRLIRESRPVVVFGEQVASKDGLAWLDVVSADLENENYAIGAIDTCAASIGAPHIRQRLYFVADSKRTGAERTAGSEGRTQRETSTSRQDERGWILQVGDGRIIDDRANTGGERVRTEGLRSANEAPSRMQGADGERLRLDVGEHGATGQCEHSTTLRLSQRASETTLGSGNHGHARGEGLPNSDGQRVSATRQCDAEPQCSSEPSEHFNAEQPRLEGLSGDVRKWRGPGWLDPVTARSVTEAGATRGFWSDCDWWCGRDEKYRPIGPGLFPLVAGATGRMGKLRGYGNAICAPQAQAFIEAYMSLL